MRAPASARASPGSGPPISAWSRQRSATSSSATFAPCSRPASPSSRRSRVVRARVQIHGAVGLELEGRVDRIVRAPDGALRVGDYKTSRDFGKPVAPTRVKRGTSLQVPLYALAVATDRNTHDVIGEALPVPLRPERDPDRDRETERSLELSRDRDAGPPGSARARTICSSGASSRSAATARNAATVAYTIACRREHGPSRERLASSDALARLARAARRGPTREGPRRAGARSARLRHEPGGRGGRGKRQDQPADRARALSDARARPRRGRLRRDHLHREGGRRDAQAPGQRAGRACEARRRARSTGAGGRRDGSDARLPLALARAVAREHRRHREATAREHRRGRGLDHPRLLRGAAAQLPARGGRGSALQRRHGPRLRRAAPRALARLSGWRRRAGRRARAALAARAAETGSLRDRGARPRLRLVRARQRAQPLRAAALGGLAPRARGSVACADRRLPAALARERPGELARRRARAARRASRFGHGRDVRGDQERPVHRRKEQA